MNSFFDSLFTRYPNKTTRSLEILPGLFSWALILSPIWGSFLAPVALAIFILFFDVYWLYKSFSLTVTAYIAVKRIKEAQDTDWLKKAKDFPAFKKVAHIAIIPNYTEPLYKVRETIASLKNQTLPSKKIYVVLAMEEREKGAMERADSLISEFGNSFGDIFATFHPDIEGEVKGKSSNQAYAQNKHIKGWSKAEKSTKSLQPSPRLMPTLFLTNNILLIFLTISSKTPQDTTNSGNPRLYITTISGKFQLLQGLSPFSEVFGE